MNIQFPASIITLHSYAIGDIAKHTSFWKIINWWWIEWRLVFWIISITKHYKMTVIILNPCTTQSAMKLNNMK